MKHPRWLWWLSVGMATAAFGLGLYGACGDEARCADGCWIRAGSKNYFDALHETLQLFVSNLPAERMHNWYIRLAALLAPFSLAGVAAYALWDAIAKLVTAARLWLDGADHLFIGTGERATSIALAKARFAQDRCRDIRVAGLDLHDRTLFRERLERLRSRFVSGIDVLVLDGHALARAALHKINARHAVTVWVTTADDALNLAIARRVADIVDCPPRLPYRARDWLRRRGSLPRARNGDPPRLLVRVSHTRLVRADHTLHDAPKSLEVEYFNLGRLVARQLFKDHPPLIPPLVPDGASLALARRPHIALCGDGDLIDSIAVMAATHWLLDTGISYCVRITLVGKDARATRTRLLDQHPALHRLAPGSVAAALEYRQFAELRPLCVDAEELEPDDWKALQSDVPFDAVYVHGVSDLSTARIASRVTALRDAYPPNPVMPIVALLQEESARPTSTASGSPLDAKQFHWFDIYRRLFENDEAIPGDELDREAKLINKAYANPHSTPTPEPAWPPHFNDEFKWSSRHSASHIDVKLMLLRAAHAGFDATSFLAPSADSTPDFDALKALIGRHVDALAELEHRRFVAERMIEGWLSIERRDGYVAASGMSVDDQKKRLRLNDTLVPFDELKKDDKDFDHAIVWAMPKILAARRAAALSKIPTPPWWLRPWNG